VLEKRSLAPIGKKFTFSLFHLFEDTRRVLVVGAWNLAPRILHLFSYTPDSTRTWLEALMFNFRLGFIAFLLNIGGLVFYFFFSIGRSIGILLVLGEARSD